jgi:hypothetical protein
VKRRLFSAGAVVSLILLFAALALWVRGYYRSDHWVLREADPRWSLLSWTGEVSFIWIRENMLGGFGDPPLPRVGSFWVGGWERLETQDRTPPVVYYARYYIKDGFLVALLAGLAVACAGLAHRPRLRESTGQCPACGYDLRGSEGASCPECGAERLTDLSK